MSKIQRSFLIAYARLGVISTAAVAARCGRRSHYDWIHDPLYAAAFAAAEEEAIERMETEARRRAVEGESEHIIYQGRLCYGPAIDAKTGRVILDDETGQPLMSDTPLSITRRADNLLMFLLKSKRPNVYRDNAVVALTGAGGGALSVEVTFVKPA